MIRLAAALLVLATATPAAAVTLSAEIEAPGPAGPLKGTLTKPGDGAARAAAVILPGSGPTDRDGNSTAGIRAAPYRLLAEALAARGVSTVRADKRGLYGSGGAVDVNAVTLVNYVDDARHWAIVAAKAAGQQCAYLIGHSEGGLIAIAAANAPEVCGIVLLETPGRKLGDVLRAQFAANARMGPLKPKADAILARLERGEHVPDADIPAPLKPLFRSAVQGYLIDLLRFDPAERLSHVTKPVMIVHGSHDSQVGPEDAQHLGVALPSAKRLEVPSMNHVLKSVADTPEANLAAYFDPGLPLAPGLADPVAAFLTAPR